MIDPTRPLTPVRTDPITADDVLTDGSSKSDAAIPDKKRDAAMRRNDTRRKN